MEILFTKNSFVIIIILIIFSCKSDLEKEKDDFSIFPFRDSTGLYGYMNNKGQTIIPPQYKCAEYFTSGVALVAKDSLYGYISSNGNWAISPRFEYAEPFEGEYAFARLLDSASQDYIITKQGKILFKKPNALEIDFIGNLFVYYSFSNEQTIILDTFGDIVKTLQDGTLYSHTKDYLLFYTDTGMFQIDKLTMEQQNLKGISTINEFSEGVASCIKNEEHLVIDENLKTLFNIPPEYRALRECKESKMTFSSMSLDGKIRVGFVNKEGTEIIKAQFSDAESFSENLAAAIIYDNKQVKWGFIDTIGNWVILPRFDEVWDGFCHGLAIVKEGNTWGYIDKKGNWVRRDKLGKDWLEDIRIEVRFDYLYRIPCKCRF